jgi:hypothetical protein
MNSSSSAESEGGEAKNDARGIRTIKKLGNQSNMIEIGNLHGAILDPQNIIELACTP